LPRVDYLAPVWLHDPWHARIRAEIANLSEGGAFLETARLLPVDSDVTCDVSLDGQRRFLRGRVAWAREAAGPDRDRPPGIGVEFQALTAEDTDALRECVVQRVGSEYPVRVWLPGMLQPVTAAALLTRNGVVLKTELPAFQLDAKLLFEFVGGDQELVGKVGRVRLVVNPHHPVPTLQIEVDVDPDAEPKPGR
jgi:Tfp pilus assembly protein PilZ